MKRLCTPGPRKSINLSPQSSWLRRQRRPRWASGRPRSGTTGQDLPRTPTGMGLPGGQGENHLGVNPRALEKTTAAFQGRACCRSPRSSRRLQGPVRAAGAHAAGHWLSKPERKQNDKRAAVMNSSVCGNIAARTGCTESGGNLQQKRTKCDLLSKPAHPPDPSNMEVLRKEAKFDCSKHLRKIYVFFTYHSSI